MEGDCLGIAPGSADEGGLFVDDDDDGVVERLDDVAVVHQPGVCDLRKARDGFVVADADGLTRDVAAGGDERALELVEQQVVKGGCREAWRRCGWMRNDAAGVGGRWGRRVS